jgi:hypothetical protein
MSLLEGKYIRESMNRPKERPLKFRDFSGYEDLSRVQESLIRSVAKNLREQGVRFELKRNRKKFLINPYKSLEDPRA